MSQKAYFHLPGLFEFYELYKEFLPLFYERREWFYEWCEIGSIYGAPQGCLWGGGRLGGPEYPVQEVLKLVNGYGISARLTFSNSLLEEVHLKDRKCNELCRQFEEYSEIPNGVIVHSELLLQEIQKAYPKLYTVSSTTKVLTGFDEFRKEVQREEFLYVVPDFRLNKAFAQLQTLSQKEKDKVEFLCNECCWIGCTDRRKCYENVSRQNIEEDCPDFVCRAPGGEMGYRFSKAMESPAFIGVHDIMNTYLPMGFSNFKIEGRGLGSALILEFLLHYLTKPEYRIHVRECIYLSNTLDLF